jgi:hypothetical protein
MFCSLAIKQKILLTMISNRLLKQEIKKLHSCLHTFTPSNLHPLVFPEFQSNSATLDVVAPSATWSTATFIQVGPNSSQ